jgi:hypothetical protein
VPDPYAPSASWFPLIVHKAGIRLFNLSAGLNYVSIKDQTVRACALVDSIKASGWLQRSTPAADIYDVIVVGAGAAGVTAAWRAASYGLNVLVVEKAETPFPALLGCTDRMISFSMYDWPEPFCKAEHFPSLNDQPIRGKRIDEDNFPVFSNSSEPQLASVYAMQWLTRLGLDGNRLCISKTKYPIEWNFGHIAVPQRLQESGYAPSPPTVSVQLTPTAAGTPAREVQAAIVILATGIGVEREVDGYQPPSFWGVNHQAPWAVPPNKNKTPADKKNIVISGAGDGAIQDTLKSLFSKAVTNLIPLAEYLLKGKESRLIEAKLLAAERHAERQLLWGADDRAVYSALQTEYDECVACIVVPKILRWKKLHLRSDVHVDWIIGNNNAFSKAFPLNRFLASVLKRSEFADIVTVHTTTLQSVTHHAMVWECTTGNRAILRSDYPPLVRHGIETYDVDLPEDYDQSARRIALSRAPLPFKPFDF